MARLPEPGSDNGVWGDVLNDFLSVTHSTDGTLNNKVVDTQHLATSSVPADGQVLSYNSSGLNWSTVSPSGSGPIPDATASTKGVVSLSGDLGGTATSPTVPGLSSKVSTDDPRLTDTRIPRDSSVTTAKIAPNSVTNTEVAPGIAQSKISNLTTDLASKSNVGHGHTMSDITGLSSELATKASSNHAHALNTLTDVNTANALDGQSLVFQGGQWGAATLTTGGTGVTDHGALTGLSDDDHPQYLNTTRGDSRYYTKTQVDTALSDSAGAVSSVAGKVGDVTLTKADVGLVNIDNTSDINKPISTAQATALAYKNEQIDHVFWDKTTNTWETSHPQYTVHHFHSENDLNATTPTGVGEFDIWWTA